MPKPSRYAPPLLPVQRSRWETLRDLVPFLWPVGDWGLRSRVLFALVFLIAAKVANVYLPLLYKQAVDYLTGASESMSAPPETALTMSESVPTEAALALPLGLLIAYGGARVATLAFSELRDAIFARVAQRAIRTMALRTFRHLHRLSLRFHLDRQTGGLSRLIERGTKAVDRILSFILFSILPSLIEIGLACGVLWWLYGATFALITLATLLSYGLYTTKITEWRLKFRRTMNDSDSTANSKAIDSLLNYETVKYFNNETHEINRYDTGLRLYENAATHSKASLALLNIGQSLIIATGLTILMILAAQGVIAGEMTIGDFVAVNAYLIQLSQPLNFLGFVYRELRQALIDTESMFQLLGQKPEIADPPEAPKLAVSKGHVRFEAVDFGYDPRRPILDKVSFEIPPGRTLAVVGPSGAGKSTVSRLLFRFYDVTAGAIHIDGQDIRAVSQDSLRAVIGMVPQDTVLFNDTIRYNIAYGRVDAPQAEIEKAAQRAHIHDFILSLPDGYDTIVGERGLKLSGGEKQRVAIARTILKNPPILLFDEATSALDSHTEREIQANLREIGSDRTVLVIAHRLSTIVDADEILVLEAGRVVERGTHETLLMEQGAYAALWARQLSEKNTF